MTLVERLKRIMNRVDILEYLYLDLEEGGEKEYQLGLTLGLIEKAIEDIEEKLDKAEVEFKIDDNKLL